MAKVEADSDLYAEVFGALAHPARRRILMTLNFAGGRVPAGDLSALFEHSWPTTTRHLRVLEQAGLISHRRDGRHRNYEIYRQRLEVARDWLDWFFKDPTGGKQ